MIKKLSFKWLEKHDACRPCIKEFKEQNETDPIKILDLLKKAKRFKDANWLICRLFNKKQCIQYAIFAAEQVINIYTNEYPNDDRPQLAIDAAKKVLNNPSKKNDVAAASKAAYAASKAAYAASNAASEAAAYAASNAAYTAATAAYAASDAAYAAAYAATTVDAAHAAACAAYTAAHVTDVSAAKQKMLNKIINYGISLLK